MLYMKGTPQQPQCGFSQQVCRVLHATGVEFDSVNVLEDESIREGVKLYSEWPTIPQLYVGGEFVGGCDIVTEAFQSGELDETFKAAGVKK
jgi:monothiol glutaredoxin